MVKKEVVEEPAEEGASPKEILLECCRRNNTELLEELLKDKTLTADFLNTATDGMGNMALHVAAQYGSYEVLDMLLDQEGLEVDPLNRMEGATPLICAINYASQKDAEGGRHMAEMLIDAGSDPRIRNRAKQRPIDLVDPRQTELRASLQKAEFAMMAGDDIIQDDAESEGGSGSESDN